MISDEMRREDKRGVKKGSEEWKRKEGKKRIKVLDNEGK